MKLSGKIRVKETYTLLYAILLNFVVFCILMILFEPSIKVDDYYMSQIAYGQVSGMYDIHLLYVNALVGYLIVFLLNIFPNIAWFTVLQAVVLLCAFILITYLFIQNKKMIWFIGILIMFQYECLIKMTFTKTTGIALTCGFVFLMAYIYDEKIWHFILGFIFITIGILNREYMVVSFLPFWVITGVICSYKRYHKVSWKQFVKIIGMSILIYLTYQGLHNISVKIYTSNPEWESFYEEKTINSQMSDYPINEYIDNEEEYKRIGCSENDLKMLHSNNLYYKNMFQSEWFKKIYSVAVKSEGYQHGVPREIVRLSNIKSFCVAFSRYIIQDSVFAIVCIMVCFLIALMCKFNTYLFVIINVLIIAEEYYLYTLGRWGRRHVDVGVFFLITCIYLYTCKILPIYNKKFVCVILSNIYLCGAIFSYNYLSEQRYLNYGSDLSANADYSKQLNKYIKSDKGHLYITGQKETVYSLWDTNVYEVMEKGSIDNVFPITFYMWPCFRGILDNYGIDNPLDEMVDSKTIRFLVSDPLEEEYVEMFETYCKEHVDERAYFNKIDEYMSINIYECVTNMNKEEAELLQ